MIKFGMWGKTEQVQTTGAQLYDFRKIPTKTNESNTLTLTNNGDGLFTLNGNGESDLTIRHNYTHEETTKLLKAGKLIFKDFIKRNTLFQVCIFVDGVEKYTLYPFDGKNEIILSQAEIDNSTTYLQLLFYENGNKNVQYNNEKFCPMLYQNGNGEWEPFTGGFPSPSPDWKQPIEVTDHPVTVTIKGGTEQQSITLVPPRPLTKWDKLEKIDGVWRWRYQSKTDKLVSFDSKFADEELSGETFCRYQSNVNPGFSSKRTETLCTKLRNDKEEDSVFFNTLGAGYMVLYFNKKLGIDTLEKANNWIALNNDVSFTFYNAAKNPEYITLPQSEQDKLNALTMYAPTTEITNDGGCTMELTYTVDTKSYVDMKIAEISKAML